MQLTQALYWGVSSNWTIEMKLSNKIGIISILIAIIGIVITFMNNSVSNNKEITNQSTNGDNSPAISNINGSVNIKNQ